jgi:hypothetical protein
MPELELRRTGMDQKLQFSSARIRDELIRKLNPNKFPKMSSRMAAILGFLLGTTFVRPAIEHIVVTSDGFVLVQLEGDAATDRFLASYRDVLRNWIDLLHEAGLTGDERLAAHCLFARAIGFFGETMA